MHSSAGILPIKDQPDPFPLWKPTISRTDDLEDSMRIRSPPLELNGERRKEDDLDRGAGCVLRANVNLAPGGHIYDNTRSGADEYY